MIFSRRKRRITRLMIVEDEPLVAFDTEHVLRDDQFEIVATVDRAAEAIAIIARDAMIDLILADYQLADGEGTAVAEAAQRAGIPIIFVAGICPPAAQALAHGHLAKPYQPRDLVQAILTLDRVLQGDGPGRLPNGFTLFDQPVRSI